MTELDEHLFRHESGRIVAVLTGRFGIRYLPMVEDAVQDAFCRALEIWPFRDAPDNPAAWLYTTARRRLLDGLRRERTALAYALGPGAQAEGPPALRGSDDPPLNEHSIKDEMLRMMFSCCHPRLSEEAQVSLVLNVLCGFSAAEIAAAFVTGAAAAEKRVARSKQALASTKSLFDLGSTEEFTLRLPRVQRALYLLFNGGYHGSSPDSPVRGELCCEAMRLTALLLEHPLGRTPATFALAALMCLTAARLPGRTDADGNLKRLADQDRGTWDHKLIEQGMDLLTDSGSGPEITEYHLEAGIAAVHALSPDGPSTDWPAIVALYHQLFALRPTPVVALNRAIAIAESEGVARAMATLEAIKDPKRLENYPFYFATLGDFELRQGHHEAARTHFKQAQRLVRSPAEKRFLAGRIAVCGET